MKVLNKLKKKKLIKHTHTKEINQSFCPNFFWNVMFKNNVLFLAIFCLVGLF